MMKLQSPIVRWAGAAMRLGHIDFGDARIVLHHVQRAVTEQRLKCEHIPTRAEIGDRKGMPETMWIAALYIGLLAQCYGQVAQPRLGTR